MTSESHEAIRHAGRSSNRRAMSIVSSRACGAHLRRARHGAAREARHPCRESGGLHARRPARSGRPDRRRRATRRAAPAGSDAIAAASGRVPRRAARRPAPPRRRSLRTRSRADRRTDAARAARTARRRRRCCATVRGRPPPAVARAPRSGRCARCGRRGAPRGALRVFATARAPRRWPGGEGGVHRRSLASAPRGSRRARGRPGLLHRPGRHRLGHLRGRAEAIGRRLGERRSSV